MRYCHYNQANRISYFPHIMSKILLITNIDTDTQEHLNTRGMMRSASQEMLAEAKTW